MAIWRNYFENAYISCFHYLVQKKLHWTERLFWLITIFICMGSTYYIISICVRDYDNRKSAYRADTDYLHWETLFPSIILCERKTERDRPVEFRAKLNKTLTNMYFNQTYLNDIKENALDIAFVWPPIFSGTFNNHCPAEPEKCLKGNFSYVMNTIRRSCDELLTYCSYNGVPFRCCEQFLAVNTTFGKCFAFNNNGGRYQNGSRVSHLQWKIRRQPGSHEGKLCIESKTSNLVISALSPNAVPNLHLGKYVFMLSQETALVDKTIYYHFLKVEEIITEESEKSVEIDKRNCRFPEENNLEYFHFYSEANCQIECFITAQMKFCGCALHTCPVGHSEVCNLTGLLCVKNNKNIMDYTYKDCNCPPDCTTTNVRTTGSTSKPVEKSFQWHNKSSTMRYVAVVPAPTLRYIRYSKTSSIDLLVLVGGTVGFFMGFSFLSIAQCICYLFVRTVTDQYRLIMETKRYAKQKTMDENFALAKSKLKMAKVESNIRQVLNRRINKNNIN